MTRNTPRSSFTLGLLTSGSLSALALAASFVPSAAHAQAFGTMVGMQAGRTIGPNGQVSVWTGANRPTIGTDTDGRPLMTIEQTQQKALLDWEDFRLQTNEVLEFRQQASNWIAVNRVHGAQAAEINGEIRAPGQVYVFNDNGVLIGKDAKINTRTLVTGRGFSDVNVDGKTTTIVQSSEKGLLDWSNMSLQAGEVLKFQQQKSDWIALNRSYNTEATRIAGDIKADGNVYLVAPRGIAVDGRIDAQQVVLSSLFMRDDQFFASTGQGGLISYARNTNGRMDPTFSNTWFYPPSDSYGMGYNPLGQTVWAGATNYYTMMDGGPQISDPNDPLKYNVTIGRTGVINTGEYGKVILAGPKVTNSGTINVRDEGQVILAAGENVYLSTTGTPAIPGKPGMLETYIGSYNSLRSMLVNMQYGGVPPQTASTEEWRAFYSLLLGREVALGETLNYSEYNTLYAGTYINGRYVDGGLIGQYMHQIQADRSQGYTARNDGIITGKRGGNVDFRGWNVEQMGAIDMTSTALFRADITMKTMVYDWYEYFNGGDPGTYYSVPGNGYVTFGKGSLTQITPDLDATDMIPVSSGPQSVGSLKINANSVHMEQDSIIYMPSGQMNVLLDAGLFVYDNNRGSGGNQGNEDGTRFMMESGATIDLSGWKTTLDMGYHQVTGKLYAAQLADSPVQRDGPLYRKEISVDRRFGTNLANWESFDNLTQGTLAQFLTNGGTLNMDIGDDFIMKSGSVIDVSGGVTTYKDGYVYTTLLRRLDGSVIDIREADPDELYMGLANEWVVYDAKWGKQTTYYIPLVSSVQGKYETSYQEGGKGGSVNILAPDALLQGTLKGETVAGRYQRNNIPAGGSFVLGHAGESEGEYVSNTVLIAAQEQLLGDAFGMNDKLSDVFGDFFGEEFDHETDPAGSDGRHLDNATLASADFFNRSTMGSYELNQNGRVDNASQPLDGPAMLVEAGVNLNLRNGASLLLGATERLEFLGSIRTEGGDVSLSGMGLKLGENTKIDTRGSWYSDYEVEEPIALTSLPRIDGGNISLAVTGSGAEADDVGMLLPSSVVLDASGGAWVNRNGELTGGKGGNLNILVGSFTDKDTLVLDGLDHARAYGLGGNGAFTLGSSKAIVIGDALPESDGEAEDADGLKPWLISPDFFHHSGFSSISFQAPSVTVNEGVQIAASSATLQLIDQTLQNGRPPAFWTPSGTDIYDVAQVEYLDQAQRPDSLRRGMDVSFLADNIAIGKGSQLATEIGGAIRLTGNSTVDGTLLAPGGTIALGPSGGAQASGDASFVTIGETGRLLAPGAALVTSRGVDAMGHEVVDGLLYDGGSISIRASQVTLAKGSVLDVSGASATFDIAFDDGEGGLVRRPTLLASNGGGISLSGRMLDINDATYRAAAGGAGARGGSFSLDWQAVLPAGGGGSSSADIIGGIIDTMDIFMQLGLVTDLDGNNVGTVYGTDLSRINWGGWIIGELSLPPGTVITDKQSAIDLFTPLDAAAKGTPPMLIIGDASGISLDPPTPPAVDPNMMALFTAWGYAPPTAPSGPPQVTVFSPDKLEGAGFSSLAINSGLGMIFSGKVDLGGRKADGSHVFDVISLSGGRIMGRAGADVHLDAGVVLLDAGEGTGPGGEDSAYLSLLPSYGVFPAGDNSSFRASAGTLLQVGSASFQGFSDTILTSGGDIRFAGRALASLQAPQGGLYTPGKLTLKADQVYAGTGRIFTILSDTGIEIQAQDDGGPINGSPYEVAAQLTLKAPTILQGGTLRSPLGTLNLQVYDNGTEGSNALILKAGSLTSVSSEGHVVPYGYTSNGDTWLDPYTGKELTTLPTKTVNLTGGTVDIQAGATLDVSGGGDLYAREFVPGIGGTKDWLTGYRDENLDWVDAPGQIYAVLPGYDGNIAPLGFGQSQIGVGDKVYLSGGSGLPAGYYTLLPAEYALLPGAFRVTAQHRYGDAFVGAPLGAVAVQTDGSSVQAGYRIDGASGARDQRNIGYLVMPGDTLRKRSAYLETTANSFFTSDAFLRKALRTNRPIGDVPRTPLDGGSVVFQVSDGLNLDGTLKSGAGEGGRGGFADIAGGKIVVAGADTDLGAYDGYLILQSDQLNAFGAESLLIGGVRHQGETNLELGVTGTDVVVDNGGSVLYGPELLFASSGAIEVKSGAQIETRGTISGTASDLLLQPGTPAFTHDNDTAGYPDDDYLVHGALDQGAVLRVSSGEQVNVLRDGDAVNAMNALRNDPGRLAAINATRASKGLAPLDGNGGLLTIADGASIKSSRSVALDATNDTRLGAGATLETRQLSAAASHVSIGAVPDGTPGLVFADGALGTLGNAAELTLKSYSSIDLYGPVSLSAADGLRLDTAQIRVIADDGAAAKISAKTLTLANSTGLDATAVAGGATLTLDATNLYIEGGEKWISGVSGVSIDAAERVIGRDDTALHLPGTLTISSGGLTAASSARLNLDAASAISVLHNGNANMPAFQSFGGTLSLTGASIDYAGQTRITGGTINLQARSGDVTLAGSAVLDVTSNVSTFYDKSVGVSAGAVKLVADQGDVIAKAGSLIDISGTSVGGDGGTLTVQAGLGEARLDGTLRGDAAAGYSSGSFSLLTEKLADFAGFNALLDAGGFRYSRRFEINHGDVTVDGKINVQNFAVVTNDGSIDVTGTVSTIGDSGGRIQLSAARDVTLAGTAQLLARAKTADGAGGTVLLETSGASGGTIGTAAGSLIDVSGTGDGGRLVRFRAPQVGDGIGIGSLAGTITGARAVIAEGYRVYDGVSVIDQDVIDRVEGDALAFMSANAAAIRARLGGGVTLTAGIELRSAGDMQLATDWDLSGVRFDGAPGVLTLRAGGDLKLDANLTDGFVGDALMDGDSWSFNLTGGANIASPDSMAVLGRGALAPGAGSVIVGGTPDTIDYYYDPAYGNENRLYLLDPNGKFAPDLTYSQPSGYIELERDPATGKYIDPDTGALIEKDPATGDYADTSRYARRPLPWLYYGGYGNSAYYQADGQLAYDLYFDGNGQPSRSLEMFQQSDNSTGYLVRTGTGAINVAAGADLVLSQRQSVIYTAGRRAADIPDFIVPTGAQYGELGGDLNLRAAGDIVASSQTPQLPSGYMNRRYAIDTATALFTGQPSWWVNYATFEGGVGALGGGNIAIEAGGDIDNLGVSIPNSARVAGNITVLPDGTHDPVALTLSGGGDLMLKAGGNILGGVFYVAEGRGDITAGGSILSGSKVGVFADPGCQSSYDPSACDIHFDPRGTAPSYDVYTMLFTSSGQFDVKSGGDLNIDGVMDPMLTNSIGTFESAGSLVFSSYTDTASVRLFSAGGDVNVWNNNLNTALVAYRSGPTAVNPGRAPLFYYGQVMKPEVGRDEIGVDIRPSQFSAIAATGDVRIVGGMTLMPAPRGNLELMAGNDVLIGYSQQAVQADAANPNPYWNIRERTLGGWTERGTPVYEGIYMSQSDPELIRNVTSTYVSAYGLGRQHFRNAGQGGASYLSIIPFGVENLPDLHVGDTDPVRIYAVHGDIITAGATELYLPKQAWFQAGGDIYFPSYTIQHNNPGDLSIVRAGGGIYFDISGSSQNDVNTGLPQVSYGRIDVAGPGRLEVEAGTDIYLPNNSYGVTSRRITMDPGAQAWHPDEKAADIAISTGFNQTPSYQAFEDAYLDPAKAGGMADYLLDPETGKSLYLFDRDYPRAQGATGEFATPEPREGLVNYVRGLQGLDPLKTKAEQIAYLDTAWSYWQSLSTDYKTPYYRSVLFLELRTTGREANDPSSDRYDTTARGYKAIETLFPGAQKEPGTALAEGESAWQGNFETYASRVVSSGGGKIEFVIPGGGMTLANAAAQPADTGQPANANDRGNALRAGIVTTDGGEIDILARNSVVVNESRILTSKGGNVMIWSSWGDIAAGKGAKTAISPSFYNYTLDNWARMKREPAGLPTGAGIGTLATQPGTPPADVDLLAPAGIVDAGDAGIRVSGNFNVYAIEILGTDNIDVAGVASGLPVAPAAPPNSLDTGEVGAKAAAVDQALDEAVAQVRKNAAITSPSIIEVHVTASSDDAAPARTSQQAAPAVTPIGITPTMVAMRSDDGAPKITFDLPPQPLDQAVRAIGRTARVNIVYDAGVLKAHTTQRLRGSMSPEEALRKLLSDQGLTPVQISPTTIVLRRRTI